MKEKEVDLAKGTFIEKWPEWLRWLLFLPASIIAPLLFLIIQTIFTNWYLGLDSDAFYFNFMRGIIYGTGFVLVGSAVAPRKQKVVALCFLIFIAMICGIALLFQLYHFIFNEFLEDIITLAAAGYTTYYIFKESDSNSNL